MKEIYKYLQIIDERYYIQGVISNFSKENVKYNKNKNLF